MRTRLLLLSLLTCFSEPLLAQNTLDNAGLTGATPSAVAFSLRKLSSTYNGAAVKVRRSSDNAEATVAFDGSNGVSAASMVTFTSGITVGAIGTVQAGTITSDVSKTGTITVKVNKTGTINVSNGNQLVTGTGTSFTTELVVGDRIFNGANNIFFGVVASITNNTSLLLTNNSTGTVSTSSFKTTNATVTGTGTNFTGELASGDRIFNASNIYLGTVSSISSSTSLTVNAVDAIAATAVNFKSSLADITGSGTNFTSLTVGDLLISNNTTLGIIASITNATALTLIGKAGASVSGAAFKTTPGVVNFSTFYSSASVYVSAWYDQSGNGRDAFQLKAANQGKIVNAGTLYIVNGRTSIEFSGALTSFLQTGTVASYLNNTLYTLNKVTAEVTINPILQFPISTTGGNGPNNTVSHYGYRSSSQFTVAQYGNDQNFNATPSTTLELHTSVKSAIATSQFYKNGISLGTVSSGAPSHLNNVGLLNIGYYTPTNSYYNGSISELIVFSTALSGADVTLLNDNQLAYYNIASTYWTGAVSTDWTNAANWSTGIVPTISSPSIVVVPAGKPFYPVISGVSPANSISLETGTSLTITGTLQIAGTINNLGTCTASSGTVQYMGSASQTINSGTFAGNVIQNLIVNNSIGVLLNGNLTISGNVSFTSGYLSLVSSTLTISGAVTNTIAGGLRGGSNSNLIINGAVSPTLSFDQTTVGSTNLLKNLTINSSGQVVNLANNLILFSSGSLFFSAGKLSIGATTLAIRGTVVNTVSNGLRGSTGSNLVIDGTVSPTLSFDQTTPGTTNALNNFTVNCPTQTVTLNNSASIVTALNVTAGILADGGNQISSTGTINIVSGTFKLGSLTAATTWPLFTTNNISTGGTVNYASGVAQMVSAAPVYHNLTISATGGTTAANDLSVNGILNLSAANPSSTLGSLSMSTYTLLMGSLATTVGQGDVTGIVTRTTILQNVLYTMGHEFSSITFPNTGTLPSQMSMKIDIGMAPSWQSGAVSRKYEFIQTGGTGTKAVISAHYLDAELNGNVENKLVDFSFRYTGSVLTEHGKSNFNTTQNYIVLSNVNVAFFSSTFGNVELSFDETALTTLTWNGSTSTSWITATNWTPNGGPSTNTVLIIPDEATTPNDPFLPASASNGSLTIESGGIVNADPGAQLTLNNSGLAWSNSGTFNAGNSTVIFTNANATINGVTNFNHVTINSGANLLMSTDATMRIGGTITNNGTWTTGLLHNTVEYNGNNQTVLVPNGTTQSYHNLVLSGTGTTVLPPSLLNINDTLTINTAISSVGNTIVMNGSVPQIIMGSAPITLNNLTINNATESTSIEQNLNVTNTLTFAAGKLAIGANTLGLSGSVTNTVANGITGGLNSNLVVSGTAGANLSFDMTNPGVSNALNNLTINTSTQVPLMSSDLEVNGTLIFTTGKLGINGNTLNIKGNLTNTVSAGLRGSSTSNIIISGAAFSPVLSFDQTTPGTTNLLNNFTINSTGQEPVLDNALLVGGILNLTDGLVLTTSINSLTLDASANFTGGSNVSFVDGPLVRNTNAITPYDFPIGKLGLYEPLSITPSTTSAGVYSSEFFPIAGPAGTYSAGLTGIANDEYWNVNRISGPDAQVTLNYRGDNNWSVGSPTTMDYIFVADNNGSNWDPEFGTTIPGNTGAGPTPVTSKVLSAFNSFTFGYSLNLALPVTLLSFKAVKLGNAIDLVWTTSSEVAFSNYEVERSADGRNFYKIGTVPAINSRSIKTYSLSDNSPLSGTSFYRLKMVDIDGGYKYSAILRINLNAPGNITIYPNPVIGDKIQLQLYKQLKGQYVFNLYNNNGSRVFNSRIDHDGNDTVKSINLNRNFIKGVYYVEVVDPQKNKKVFKVYISN